MKAPGLSLAAVGFAILVIAIDFAVIRAAFAGTGAGGWAGPGARLLPHMLADPLLGPGREGWAVFAFFLLPMIDALLIGAFRLRRREDRTAETVGFVVAGSLATLAIVISCLNSPGTAVGILRPISRRIALASLDALAWLFGVASPNLALEWTYAVILAVLVPIALFCIPPLLVAVIGGWVARRFGSSRPIMGAGSGEKI